ncbi:MAG: excinuclease ABC subunit UvrC [Bacillota bacterium]
MLSLEDRLKNLPEKPGVYIMKDEYDEIIYVGKAINLKNRVRQYFHSSIKHPKVAAMVEKIENLEYIITDSELEALILECNLIKKHKPRYNILMKDGKTYPYIKVNLNEDFPRVMMTREIKKDGAKYYGPYTDGYAVNKTLELIKRMFPLRDCSKNLSKIRKNERPCLNYHINKCMAPCQGNVSREEYYEAVKSVCMLLDGKQDELIKVLEEKMNQAAEELDFEKAADLRDNINSLRKIGEKQKIVSSSMEDQDIIALAREKYDACVQIFFVRGGKLVGREHFFITESVYENEIEIMCGFIKQFYSDDVFIPKEIILHHKIEDIDIIEAWLKEKKGSKVKIIIPQKGEKLKLVEMVEKNAHDTLMLYVEKQKNDEEKTIGAIKELAGHIGLEKLPDRIEAYDISHLQGVENVGSMIVFEGGKAKYKDYRRFKIKYVEGADDYQSMKEILSRRFLHGMKEREELDQKGKDYESGKFSAYPDLILIDGGVGQVNAAKSVLSELNLNIPVCGMVKDDKHRTRGLICENEEKPIAINTNAFRLITNIQDEAHRFAVSYHRSLRQKTTVKSALDEIPGIGPARRQSLIKHFGSLKKIKDASIEELSKAEGMNKKIAEIVYNFFRI